MYFDVENPKMITILWRNQYLCVYFVFLFQKSVLTMKYNLEWLFENIKIELDAVKFFQENKIIPANKKCRRKHDMVFKECAGNVVWRCSKSACGQERLSAFLLARFHLANEPKENNLT